ncbi:DUF805 domain-containing protein [Pedobacter frigoris]|uniref:DUF805 domain-containing protein n=1 Tax=Pedobacter frigoris TaxID=2571272 RepID=A0A4U1CHV4_9SPHI|nr:DUF805 domain-containing protein [Pedobacter frigoris]TKC06943.1 DUF805 domain-containing protein [Pedobacter frigoris]
MFKNPFSFEGRIRRLEYGLSNVVYMLLLFGVVGLLMAFGDPRGPFTNIFMLLLWIPLAWFMLAQGAKRCHDRGNSGWWQIIPFYGIWMLFADGEIGDNEYGGNPKGMVQDTEAVYKNGEEAN